MPKRIVPQCFTTGSLGSLDGVGDEPPTASKDVEADIASIGSYDSYNSRTSLEENEKSEFCCGLCCFQGCMWGIIAMLYLFVLIPGGLLMVWYGYRYKAISILVPGICVLLLAVIGIPVTFFVFRHLKKRRRERTRAYEVQRNNRKMAATYENPMAELSEEAATTDRKQSTS